MKTVVHKFFGAWNFDKEEAWLNDMANRGYALHSYSFCRYVFENCEPGEYSVRIELLDQLPNNPTSQQYIRFVEETGAQHVASYLRWVYFRKKRSDGEFNLFSDLESRIRHLQRIWRLMLPLMLINLWYGLFNGLILSMVDPMPFRAVHLLNLLMAILLSIGLWKIWKKIDRLKKDRQIFE